MSDEDFFPAFVAGVVLALLMIALCHCGAPPPAPVCPLAFPPADACIKRHECCFVTGDGVHCTECCGDGITR